MLQDYVEYIAATSATNENEKISKLLNVIISANQYSIDVEGILQQFEAEINAFAQQQPSSDDMYTQQVISDYIAWFVTSYLIIIYIEVLTLMVLNIRCIH